MKATGRHAGGGKQATMLTRRDFVGVTAAAAGGAAVAGCATNPVTGRKQFLLLSESGEVDLDRKNVPHQLSADYGPVTDDALNAYIAGVGAEMAALTHRPHMPYSFRVVNATYVNAYAFPGGSIAATRGIMLELENEAELAALLGHELGHVNARHTAQRMTKGMLAQLAVAAVAAYVASENEKYTELAAGLGGVGAGLLLAHYSRDNERQADELGLAYMVRAGYNPAGMVGLMDGLRRAGKHKPSALDRMFSTHPMSDERYETACGRVKDAYAEMRDLPLHKERYMDRTARLRAMRPAILEMQKGDAKMVKKKFDEAKSHYAAALAGAPGDYAGLLSMAKCLLALGKADEARAYVEKAKGVMPAEPQAVHVSGMLALNTRRFDEALASFSAYEQMLPGNANSAFYKGYTLESMGWRAAAAKEYQRYRRAAPQGEFAGLTAQRLTSWGYLQPAGGSSGPR